MGYPRRKNENGIEHKVTLSRQALALLKEIKKAKWGKRYLFPNSKYPQKHINTQTSNSAIKRMGYKGRLVAHGFALYCVNLFER